ATGSEPSPVKALDGFAIGGLERQVCSTGNATGRGGALLVGNDELIRPEEAGTFASPGDVQGLEDRSIKALAALEIGDDDLHVVDQATPMKFVDFHTPLVPPSGGSCHAERCGALVATPCLPQHTRAPRADQRRRLSQDRAQLVRAMTMSERLTGTRSTRSRLSSRFTNP